MLIFDGDSNIVLLNSITGPTLSDHVWILDLNLPDFTIVELNMLEEIQCPTVTVLINGFEFNMPANWNVLVYDRDTAQLDAISFAEAAGREFTAFVYGPKQTAPLPAIISLTNYISEQKHISPALHKHQMLCHPISPDQWICVSPSDSFNKYLKNIIVGDLI